jgi:hypothetical protein
VLNESAEIFSHPDTLRNSRNSCLPLQVTDKTDMHYLIREFGISPPLLLGPIKSRESQNSRDDFKEPTTDVLACDTRTSIRVRD